MVFDFNDSRFQTATQMATQFLHHFDIGENQISQADSDEKQ